MSFRSAVCVLVAVALLPASAASAAPKGAFTFAAGGDTIGPFNARWAVKDAAFKAVAELFGGADVGFANHEGSVFDPKDFKGWPAAENGGGYPRSPATTAADLKAMGIDIVGKANNHATDWGTEGLVLSQSVLKAAGVVVAGSGDSEKSARAPAYFQSPRGRVAVVSVASTYLQTSVAGDSFVSGGEAIAARPGISVLRAERERLLAPERLETLRRLVGREMAQIPGSGEEVPVDSESGPVRIGSETFAAGVDGATRWKINAGDAAAVLDAVRVAAATADFVIFAIHAHEADSAKGGEAYPAAFLPELFHQVIDAGADAVVRTGPHVVGGVEIYKGKPIYYSLGSLFFGFGGKKSYQMPSGHEVAFPEAYFETVIPVASFTDGRLREIRFHPMAIESSTRPTDGRPIPASPAQAIRILESLRAASLPFGARIEIDGSVGVLRP